MRLLRVLGLLGLSACAGSTPRGPGVMQASWPAYFVTVREVALFPEAGIQREVGRLAAHVQVETEPGTGGLGMIPVHVPGPLEVWGAIEASALGGVVCTAGDLPGAPLYAGRGDVLELIAPAQGTVRARARVKLPGAARDLVEEVRVPGGMWCALPPEPAEPPGTPFSVKPGMAVSVLERPGGGKTLHVLPASEFGYVVRRLGVSGEHSRVLVGDGPYLSGWVRTSALDEGAGGLVASGRPAIPGVLLGARWTAGQPLHRVLAGTDVTLAAGGRGALARLRQPGYARVIQRDATTTHAVLAIDDAAHVEGLVATASIAEAVTP